MSRIIAGMSGGVDSAVAAYLLKQAGHEVIGVTLRTWESSDGMQSRCCEIDDAREAARIIGIPYYAFNCLRDFREHVTAPFIEAYIRGMTPNPCIPCNRYVKWERMLYYAQVLHADHVATGHYASVVRLDNGRYTLKKALYSEKDQSYMLYRLTQRQLAATLMPLGKYTKPEVRAIAGQAGLPVAEKRDSQEICFVPGGSYAAYIEKNASVPPPGEGFFVDEAGKRLGTHRGIFHYTVGQRKGLGIAFGRPVYVKAIRPETNEVVLGDGEALYRGSISCGDVHFMSIPDLPIGGTLPCAVKVRYRHPPQAAVIGAVGPGQVRVWFRDPVRAPAPGQAAVFYDENDCVIGGGTILPDNGRDDI